MSYDYKACICESLSIPDTGHSAHTMMFLLMLLILQMSVQDPCPNDKYRNCLQGNCTRTTTGKTECAEGCVRGFLGTGCRIPCPEHCEMCDRFEGTCLICSGDVNGDYCNNTCDAICHGFHCNKDGTCSNSTCQDGWYGPNCSNQCNQTFLRCGKTDRGCIACKHGFYGMDCQLGCNKYGLAGIQMQETCLSSCATDHEVGGHHICTGKTLNCLNHNCTRTQSGKTICAAGCVEGFWGTICRIPCPENCQTCERLQEKCTKCKDNQYGLFCNLTCQEQCHGFQCNQAGTCSDTACTDGRYGDDCSRECGKGCKACNRTTGHCMKCKSNYYGKTCDRHINTNDTPATGKPSVWFVLSVSSAVVFVTIVVAIIACYKRRG
ncbi:platelet endothelial aggregation receptor 1-like [Haliotis rubra]|uniref:platelet endothelial aggregation receptor 1-like n=1 Tax=Haliotis rubra TaxID=36100 RepID=UPI001EE60B22|nr:platelet endothelial aggregation receptor 1-like [Haliotis rubra]